MAECGGGEPSVGVLSFFSRRVSSLLFRGPSEQVGGAGAVGPVGQLVEVLTILSCRSCSVWFLVRRVMAKCWCFLRRVYK